MYDLCIVGGGAAGLSCAIAAGKLGHKILLIDKNNKAVDVEKSYVKITKADEEYVQEVLNDIFLGNNKGNGIKK